MTSRSDTSRLTLLRQINHWRNAVKRLGIFEELAAPFAWAGLERTLGTELRASFHRALENLSVDLARLSRRADRGEIDDWPTLADRLNDFRLRYMRTETAIDFYADAVNSRTNDSMRATLSGLDCLATISMGRLLRPLQKSHPPVLTYVDKGLGASILKAGLRLWEPSIISPAAAIKLARHNLARPTALIHETGHQVAHLIGWTEDLAEIFRETLSTHSSELAETWAGWTSEIVADSFAFVHTGYAAVANLHDVLAGDHDFVLRFVPGDPHPISYIRVLLNVEMCAQSFGAGPWNDLATSWVRRYPLEDADPEVAHLVAASIPLLPTIASICLKAPLPALGDRSLQHWVDPRSVSPRALSQLEESAGGSLFQSPVWSKTDGLRILALIGLRVSTDPDRMGDLFGRQERWLQRLGALPFAA